MTSTLALVYVALLLKSYERVAGYRQSRLRQAAWTKEPFHKDAQAFARLDAENFRGRISVFQLQLGPWVQRRRKREFIRVLPWSASLQCGRAHEQHQRKNASLTRSQGLISQEASPAAVTAQIAGFHHVEPITTGWARLGGFRDFMLHP